VELAEHIFNESRTLDSLSIGILGLGEIGNKGKHVIMISKSANL